MRANARVAPWLWRMISWGFVATVLAVLGLAAALSTGLADPPRAGPLLWQEDFTSGAERWELRPPAAGTLGVRQGGLWAEFGGGEQEQVAVGLTPGPTGDFTLEVAAAQVGGAHAAAYGLIFAWRDEAYYSAVLINGNGYAKVFHQTGDERRAWFPWQQWPHILLGGESNRVRVDVRGGQADVRVNDELLAEAVPSAVGKIGWLVRASGPSQVVVSWVRVWARP